MAMTQRDTELLQWDPTKTSLQTKLGELVQFFQVSLSANGDGNPRAYIDPTAIAPYLLEINTPDDLDDTVIAEATIPVEYDEGMPTVGGIPIWERFDGEPVPYYKLFKEYREMKYLDISRSIAKLAEASQISGKQLNALARVYHWQLRVKAYDKQQVQEKQLIQQKKVESLESRHAKIANGLLEQAVDFLEKHPEQLSPKVALQLAEFAMKAERLSIGLSADKPIVTGEGSGSGGRGTGGTHIMINNNAAETLNQVNVSDGLSDVERKAKADAQDPTHLQSVLHVLNKSGAFKVAAGQEIQNPEALDVDFEVVES